MAEDKNTENPEVVYDEMATDTPTRDVDLPLDAPSAQSFSDRSIAPGDLTDMQAILLRLYPELGGNLGALAMMGRIHPDVFLPWIEILATNEVMGLDPLKPIDVAGIRMKYYSLLSIGLDGKGRIDALELGGAARDTKIAEKKLDL